MRPEERQNRGMLWFDRVRDRRSQAILARYFSEKNRDKHKDEVKRASTKNWFHKSN